MTAADTRKTLSSREILEPFNGQSSGVDPLAPET